MSYKKLLQEKGNVSYIDLFSFLFPEAKTKYYDLFLRLIRNELTNFDDTNSIYNQLSENIKDDNVKMKMLHDLPLEKLYGLVIFLTFLESSCEFNIDILKNFISYNERNLITKNDLSKYKTYNDLVKETALASLKSIEKDMEKQIYNIYDDNVWLVFRPLTTQSSIKYGYGTKWCTSMTHDNTYFSEYSHDGILIYIINRVTGDKFSCYKKDNSVLSHPTFWDAQDNVITPPYNDIPQNIINIVYNEIKQNSITNLEILKNLCGNDNTLHDFVIDQAPINGEKSNYVKFL